MHWGAATFAPWHQERQGAPGLVRTLRDPRSAQGEHAARAPEHTATQRARAPDHGPGSATWAGATSQCSTVEILLPFMSKGKVHQGKAKTVAAARAVTKVSVVRVVGMVEATTVGAKVVAGALAGRGSRPRQPTACHGPSARCLLLAWPAVATPYSILIHTHACHTCLTIAPFPPIHPRRPHS